jgi:hypothetical protein
MSPSGLPRTPVTLHAELGEILRSRGNVWMTTTELATAVNDRDRYRKKDTTAVSASQVGARIRQSGHQFERDGNQFRLRAALSTFGGMPERRYLMHQWSRRQWEHEKAEERQGEPLRHSASDAVEYSQLERGDRLYIVGQEKGKMLLLGRMDVDLMTSDQRVVDERLGPDLYEAEYHVLAGDCTAIRFDVVVPEKTARSITTEHGAQLTFASDSEYRLKPTSLQPRMWLDEASALALDALLDSAAADAPDPDSAIRSVPIEAVVAEGYEVITAAAVRTALRGEQRLVREYVAYMEGQGDDVDRHEIPIADQGAWLVVDIFNKTREQLIEAKAHATRNDVRMAIGQLADYGRATPGAQRAVLLPEKPDDDLLALLASQDIAAIWKDGSGFDDTANGDFTTRRRGTPT